MFSPFLPEGFAALARPAAVLKDALPAGEGPARRWVLRIALTAQFLPD